MIGPLTPFRIDLNLAVLAVLSYRAISFWLLEFLARLPTSSCVALSRVGVWSRRPRRLR